MNLGSGGDGRGRQPAAEKLIVILGLVIAFILVLEAVALVVMAFVDPDNVKNLSGIFQTQVQIVLGAVLGYATGRAVGTGL